MTKQIVIFYLLFLVFSNSSYCQNNQPDFNQMTLPEVQAYFEENKENWTAADKNHENWATPMYPYTVGFIDQPGGISLSGFSSIGQSFEAKFDGCMTSFQIDVASVPQDPVTVQVWRNSDLNPMASFTGPGHSETDQISEQTIEITQTGVQTITLPFGVQVEEGTVYSVEMFAPSLFLRYYFPATFSPGRVLWSNNLFGCCDLKFEAFIEENCSEDLPNMPFSYLLILLIGVFSTVYFGARYLKVL